jgi:hypothetical protein
MSATAQASRPDQAAGRAVPGLGTGLLDALHAEWTKLRTISGPGWLLHRQL